MTAQVALRPAHADDLPALVEAQRAIAAVPGRFRSAPDEVSGNAMRTALAAAQAGNGCFLVAQAAGELVGHGWLVPGDVAAQRHAVRLQLAAHEGHQGRGLGRALLTALLDWARARPELRKVQLTVRAANTRAVRLYVALGFEVEGCLRESLRLADGATFDDLLMALWLPGQVSAAASRTPLAAISVRPARSADFAAIARLGDAVNALHHDRFPFIFTPAGDLAAHEAFWRARWREGAAEQFFVAEHGGAVVGFASAQVVDETPNALVQAHRFVRVGSVCVDAPLRGRGIGTALMQAIHALAAQEGAREVRLNVWDFNRGAIALYERLGYELRSRCMARPIG